MKKRVYLDSTIFSYIYDTRDELKYHIEITQKWWNSERENYWLYVSDEVVAELNSGFYPQKEKTIDLLNGLNSLECNSDVIEIAQFYIDNLLMPKKLKGDSLHLACASYYDIDFLLTWNCSHLANANKKQHIRFLNARLNLKVPEIITPLELFTEESDA